DLGGNLSDQAHAVAHAPDGRIYLAGSVAVAPSRTSIGVTRLMQDGAVDLSFKGGRVSYLDPLFHSASIYDAAVQSDGKLIVVGSGTLNGEVDTGMLVCRLKPDGEVDSSFGDQDKTPGCTYLDTGAHGAVLAIALVGNDEMILAGSAFVAGRTRALLVKL